MLDDLATGADSDVMDAAVDIIYFDFLWPRASPRFPQAGCLWETEVQQLPTVGGLSHLRDRPLIGRYAEFSIGQLRNLF